MDVFPKDPSRKVQRLTPLSFKNITSQCEIVPFIIYIATNDKIYYHKCKLTEQCLIHSQNVIKDAMAYDGEFMQMINKGWNFVKRRLKKPPNEPFRKNSDHRTCFLIKKNLFIVKSSFSFGLRIVRPGTKHILQLLNVPVVFYYIDSKNRYNISVVEKSFRLQDECNFQTLTLEANKAYSIPEKTQYLIVTFHKTIFALDIIDKDSAPVKFPTTHVFNVPTTKTRIDPYAKPIRTPYIGDDQRDLMPPPPPPPPSASSSASVESDDDSHLPTPSVPTAAPTVEDKTTETVICSADKTTETCELPEPSYRLLIVSLEKEIKIVNTHTVQWYQSIRHPLYISPPIPPDFEKMDSDEMPLDLSLKAPPHRDDSTLDLSAKTTLPPPEDPPEPAENVCRHQKTLSDLDKLIQNFCSEPDEERWDPPAVDQNFCSEPDEERWDPPAVDSSHWNSSWSLPVDPSTLPQPEKEPGPASGVHSHPPQATPVESREPLEPAPAVPWDSSAQASYSQPDTLEPSAAPPDPWPWTRQQPPPPSHFLEPHPLQQPPPDLLERPPPQQQQRPPPDPWSTTPSSESDRWNLEQATFPFSPLDLPRQQPPPPSSSWNSL